MAHQIVSREEWNAARTQLLTEEKRLTRERDRVAALRREMPWVRLEKTYTFDGPNGRETLADLFAGRSQLVVRHFMFGPGWQEGCVSCSFWADHLDGALPHLAQRDVSVVTVSRAPFAELEAFRARMGWRFKWVSSFGSDFNYDFNVSFTPEQIASGQAHYNFRETDLVGEEMPGLSVFHRSDDGTIAHTYSAFGRGNEGVMATYAILDVTPKGRDETGPRHNMNDWVRLHDRYN